MDNCCYPSSADRHFHAGLAFPDETRWQHYSGAVQRVACVDAGQYGAELDAAGLRALAADAVAAADELDGMIEK